MNDFLFISLPAGGELVIILVALLAFVFWITQLIDVIKTDFDSGTTKIVWVLVVIFLGVIGALIYHFVGKPTKHRPI